VGGAFYLAGWKRLGDRDASRAVLPAWRVWAFFGGLATIWLALLSPIGVYSELFFFMHMIQHLLLVEVAAPLLLLGAPLLPMLWALPKDARVGLGRLFAPGPVHSFFTWLTHPLTAVAVFCTVMSVWHIPQFYDAAQGRTLIHDLEHAIFLGAALLFWWPVIHPAGGRRRLNYLAGLVYFVPPMSVGSLIGALLTFAHSPVYQAYQKIPRVWGISVVGDQQLAGLIMWVPGGLVYIIPVFAFLVLLFQEKPEGDEVMGDE
jgi:cytochrome c oxidase assembly factor CtaG